MTERLLPSMQPLDYPVGGQPQQVTLYWTLKEVPMKLNYSITTYDIAEQGEQGRDRRADWYLAPETPA
jgi:hypothetical protein